MRRHVAYLVLAACVAGFVAGRSWADVAVVMQRWRGLDLSLVRLPGEVVGHPFVFVLRADGQPAVGWEIDAIDDSGSHSLTTGPQGVARLDGVAPYGEIQFPCDGRRDARLPLGDWNVAVVRLR